MKYSDVIAMRIKELLKQKNLNTNSLAIKSGINESTIRSILNKSPTVDTIRFICIGFGIKVYEFYNSEFVYSLDERKAEMFKKVFWEMNDVNFSKEKETRIETIVNPTGTEYKNVTYTKLHIKISSKNASEMADIYNFNNEQRKQLEELLKDDYNNMWAFVIYGNSSGSNDIVNVALS